jgi:hypothetical protein
VQQVRRVEILAALVWLAYMAMLIVAVIRVD